jgi:glycine dehydrogenase subunit 1
LAALCPAVCDAIGQRQEFLTAYEGDTYSDLGKWQALFEYQSLMGELLNIDVVSFPVYDGASAAAYAIRMATRLTGRKEVLVSKAISPEKFSIIRNMMHGYKIKQIEFDGKTGLLSLNDLRTKISKDTATVYFENPSFFGLVEDQGDEIANAAHNVGAKAVVGVDPISLGVVKPPSEYGADIVCGDLQPLGLHMQYGGSLAGFIASGDDAEMVAEYPTWLVSITETANEGEFGFGLCTPERTHFFQREKGKDFTGTGTALFGIIAGVYLALMGPRGMKAIGESILERSHYAAQSLEKIRGIQLPFKPQFFKDFVVSFRGTSKSISSVNRSLLRHKIFGGYDLGKIFPELTKCALYSATEVHTKEDIDRLATALRTVLRE